jgi:hypothetical protein
MHRAGVRNVNTIARARLLLTFGTYAGRNVNRGTASAARLTKCTPPDPTPSMPQFKR